MGDDDAAETFSRRLDELKRQGCNVLVVNDVRSADAACERLLGAPDLDRSHLFVPTTISVQDVLDRHGSRRTDPHHLGVVDATGAGQTRSAAASAGEASTSETGPATGPTPDGTLDPDGSPEWRSTVDDFADLDDLYAEIRTHLDRIATDPEAPGGIRVCVDSLDPFFDLVEHGSVSGEGVSESEFFRFLHLLTRSIRDVRGVGHFHVAAEIDEPRTQLVEPLFDATIYVDTEADGSIRQRWRLHDSGQATGWLPLE